MENKRPVLLSIIVPAYNVESYIRECLDSVFDNLSADNENNVEVIVINDGSLDGTLDIVREYNKEHPLILIDQKSTGVSNARNCGMRVASGKYLMFVDSDDYLVSDSLDKLLAFLTENEDAEIVEYDFYEFVNANNKLKDMHEMPSVVCGRGEEIYASWVNDSFFRHLVWTKIVLRDLVITNDVFFYEGIIHEDEEWTPRIFAYAKKVLYLPLHVYTYRIREGSLTSKMTRRSYFDRIKVFDSLVRFSSTNGFTVDYARALRCSASSLYWGLFRGIKLNGEYDEELIGEIAKREFIIKYSSTFHRRFVYRFLIRWFGIKPFYFFKYSLKSVFL